MHVEKDFKPHKSHKMSKWRGTIVTLIPGGTSRFGEFRDCEKCGAEEAKTVSGHQAHEELKSVCVD
jgi:hypothetical protein